MACFNIFDIFDIFLHRACSMQHESSMFFDIPWILQNLLFLQTSFWQESFFNISNHLPDSGPESHLRNWPTSPNYPFDLTNNYPG